MMECYSNGMGVVLGTYKKVCGENDKSRLLEKGSVAMHE